MTSAELWTLATAVTVKVINEFDNPSQWLFDFDEKLMEESKKEWARQRDELSAQLRAEMEIKP